MAGPKAMFNFMSSFSLTSTIGRGTRVDLSDIPMSLEEIKDANLSRRGITIVGLHLLLPRKKEDVVIPSILASNLYRLIISYTEYKDIVTQKDQLDAVKFQSNNQIKIKASMPKLKYFSCRSRMMLKDLNFLEESYNLRYMELSIVNTEFLFLDKYTKITHLYILEPMKFPLVNIRNLTSLKELIIADKYGNVVDTNLLAHFTNLRHIYIAKNANSNLDFLSECKNLETLVIEEHNLVNLDSLSSLPQLRSLYLGDFSTLVDISGLQYVPHLEVLTILSNTLTSVAGIEFCPRLEELTIPFLPRLFGKAVTYPSIKYIKLISISEDRIEIKPLLNALKSFPNMVYLVFSFQADLPPGMVIFLVKFPFLKKIWGNQMDFNVDFLRKHGIQFIQT